MSFVLAEAGLTSAMIGALRRGRRVRAGLAAVAGAALAGSCASYLYSTGQASGGCGPRSWTSCTCDEHVLDVGCGRGAV
ncbi:MAG: SAM-dependent methyltransferase, partial [Solirubrobacteraceae bacterium]